MSSIAIAPETVMAVSGAAASYGEIALSPDPAGIEYPGAAVIDRAPLTAALAIAGRIIEKRNTIPILSNALLQSVGDAVEIVATDLDMELRVRIPCAVDTAFRATVPAHMLESLLKKAAACDMVAFTTHPGEVVKSAGTGEMVSSAGEIAVEFERAKYTLKTLPVADFPIMTKGEFSHAFAMPGKELWDMIDGTMAAISTEETRYYLNGIYAHSLVRGNFHGFTMVATDGHRLYRMESEARNGALGMPGSILPTAFAKLIHTLFKGKACPDEATLSFSGWHARIAWGNVEITTKLIDGTFPDYQRVIPTGNDKRLVVDRDALAEAIKSVALISSERGRSVKMLIEAGRVLLTVTNPDAGRAEAEIAGSWDADGVLEIGFNARYLESALADVGSGDVTMYFGDSGSPVRITGSREGWDATLMPMRV